MSEQLQLRRGTAAQIATFTGAQGETVVDTTNNRLVVQDGMTQGGWAAAKLSEVSLVARTAVTASYSALSSDRLIAVTSLVSPLTITLPAAASFQQGARLLVIDETGVASFSTPITIVPQGTDIVAGVYASSIATPHGFLEFESNGIGQWTISDGVSATTSSSTSTASSSPSSSPTSVQTAFSGQASLNVAQAVFSAVIAEPRLKAGMRPIVGVVNPLIATKGILANVNLTGFVPGEMNVFGVLSTLDGKIAASPMARVLLTLNYHGV